MMIPVILLLMCVAFVELFRALDARRHVTATLGISRESLAAVRSTTLDDDQKEAITRQASVALARQSLLFVGKLLLIVLILGAIYLAAVHLIGVDADQLDARLLSPLVWLAMTAAAAAYVWIRHAIAQRL